MRSGIDAVQLEVLASERESGTVPIEASHLRLSVERQRERKPARVREAVQRRRDGAGVAPQSEPIVALVEKEPGLLPGPDVYRECDAVLAHDDVLWRLASPQHAPPRSAAFVGVRVRFLVDDL